MRTATVNRRRLLLLGLLAGLLVLCVGAWLLWPRSAILGARVLAVEN